MTKSTRRRVVINVTEVTENGVFKTFIMGNHIYKLVGEVDAEVLNVTSNEEGNKEEK